MMYNKKLHFMVEEEVKNNNNDNKRKNNISMSCGNE